MQLSNKARCGENRIIEFDILGFPLGAPSALNGPTHALPAKVCVITWTLGQPRGKGVGIRKRAIEKKSKLLLILL